LHYNTPENEVKPKNSLYMHGSYYDEPIKGVCEDCAEEYRYDLEGPPRNTYTKKDANGGHTAGGGNNR